MQHHIPNELRHETARLAASMSLNLDAAVRHSLDNWVCRVSQNNGRRIPDVPILPEASESIPIDLPRSKHQAVSVVALSRRNPDGVGIE